MSPKGGSLLNSPCFRQIYQKFQINFDTNGKFLFQRQRGGQKIPADGTLSLCLYCSLKKSSQIHFCDVLCEIQFHHIFQSPQMRCEIPSLYLLPTSQTISILMNSQKKIREKRFKLHTHWMVGSVSQFHRVGVELTFDNEGNNQSAHISHPQPFHTSISFDCLPKISMCVTQLKSCDAGKLKTIFGAEEKFVQKSTGK